MSLNNNLGISDERAKEISKQYASVIKPIYLSGKLTESASLEIIMGMKLSDNERIWFAYHVGGINRILLYGDARDLIINW